MLFASNDIQQYDSTDSQRKAAAVRLSLQEKYTLGKYNEAIAQVIGEPKMGDCINYVTGARWSAHNMLHYLLKITGPASLYVSTYTISEDAVRLLANMMDSGIVTELHALIDKRFDNRNAKALQFAKEKFTSLKLKDCHAKVTVVMNDAWQISIVGSANYSNNPRIERGTLFCSYEAANFDKQWIMEEINNNKPFGK